MPSDEVIGAFKTHANYLRAFAHLSYSGFESRHHAYRAIVDRRQVRASLENAWSTELLLTLGAHVFRDEEVIRLSNNWNVVQAYYVVYPRPKLLLSPKYTSGPQPIGRHSSSTMSFFRGAVFAYRLGR